MVRLAAALLGALFLLSFSAAAEQTEESLYFYLNACESCDAREKLDAEFKRLTGQDAARIGVNYVNVYRERGRLAYDRATVGLSDDEKKLPLLLWKGKAYAGSTAITQGMNAYFEKRGEDKTSRLYFLTATACESCREARKSIEALPALISLETEKGAVSSPVEVVEVNISSQPEMAMALFDHYGVPEDQRFAPAVFLGSSALIGREAIAGRLADEIRQGKAVGTPVVMSEPEAVSGFSFLGTAAAGLTAGLNPCALSMLLVFAGILLSTGRSMLGYGLCYLVGKLSVYLLIGLAFAQLWNRYAPAWLPSLVRIAVTIIGLGVIALNLSDAFHARREQYGRIHNQLPASLRGGLRGLIMRFVNRQGRFFLLGTVALGGVVAAGEFLCAGQLYVAVLIAGAGQGMFWPLIVYSFAFLVPSSVLLSVAAAGHKTVSASDWLLRRMPLIKLLTAAVMSLILAYIWLAK